MEGPLPSGGRAFFVFGGWGVRDGRGWGLRRSVVIFADCGVGPVYPIGTPGVAIPRPPVTLLSAVIVTGQSAAW